MQVNEKCLECGKQIPWVCFWGNSVLAIFKISVGTLSGSKGLVADGFHSGSDVLATVMVIISLKIADKDSNKRHPWGYGKIEYLGSLFVYIVLFVLGVYIFFDSVFNIIMGTLEQPHLISLFAATVSIFGNLIFSSYGFCAGKRLHSPAMVANANENKADMISSIAVVLGVAGAHMGFGFADALAAIIVACILLKMSVELFLEALSGLMDMSINKKAIEQIRNIAFSRKGVLGVNPVKTRKLGGDAWVEMEILVDPRCRVSQATTICLEVRTAILRKAAHIKEAVVTFAPDQSRVYKFPKDKPRKRIFDFTGNSEGSKIGVVATAIKTKKRW